MGTRVSESTTETWQSKLYQISLTKFPTSCRNAIFCGVSCPAHIELTYVGRIIAALKYRARIESQAKRVTGIRIRHCQDSNLHLSKWNEFF